MAYKPVAGSAATPAPSSYKPVSPMGVTPEGASDESGSPSVFGFLGNVVDEAQAMVQGVTSLVGMGISDIGTAIQEGVTLGQADTEGFKLDDVAMALPKALAQDYNDRYGLSEFADGDIWGGLKAIFTGLYEHPLSAIGDALMVGSAAKWGAKAGMLGESLGAKVLGPGAEEVATLTGAATTTQKLSQNPVARIAQRKLYETMSYGGLGDSTAARLGFGGPQEYIVGKANAGAYDQAVRATQNLAAAAGEPGSTPMRVLRPSMSTMMEKRGVNTILSHMGMTVGDKATAASAATRRAVEGLDDDALDRVTSVSMGTEVVDPAVLPSAQPSVAYHPSTQPEGLPDFATFVDEATGEPGFHATEGTSPHLLDAAQDFNKDFERWGDPRGRVIGAPDDLTVTERNAVTLLTDDMDAAYDVAQRYADRVGGQVVAAQNHMADLGSYDGMAYGVRAADGTLHRVNVATPELLDAQETWTHMALDAQAKTAELDALDLELKQLAAESADGVPNPNAEMAIAEQQAKIMDDLEALEAWNDQTFNGTRRARNAREMGGEYDPALAAADRIRNIVYNHGTRIEIKAGNLTYRKILDRAFGPIRAEKWSRMMKIIEDHVSTRLERAMNEGVPKDQWDDIILDVTDHVMGRNNPWAESMFRTRIKENIPFETDEVMPSGLGGRPGNLQGKLATGERTIDPRPYSAPKARGQQQMDLADQIEAGVDVDTALANTDLSFYEGAADEIAQRLVSRVREATHKAMVENGEMPGLTWKDLSAEQLAKPGGVFPNYFPHIKSSNVTGDVMMLNQNRSQMKTVLEGQSQRMKKWGGWLYERGAYERNPIKAYEAMFQQVQRHAEFRDTLHLLIDKYGRKVNPDELSSWDLEARGEVLVSRTGLDGMIDGRSKVISLTHDGVMQGKTLEKATIDALDAVLDSTANDLAAGIAVDDVWALPKYVAKQMKASAQMRGVLGDTFNFYYDSAMGLWKSAALSMSPRWVVNNSLGNMIYMGMSRPGAIRHFISQLMPGARSRFRAAFGDNVLNAVERDFMHGEDLLDSTQRLARRADNTDIGVGKRIAESSLQQTRPVRAVRGFSGFMRNVNKHVEGAARRGVAIDDIRRANIEGFATRFWNSKKIMEDVSGRGISDMGEYNRIVSSVNNVLGDYLTMSPVEAQIVRRFVMPFYAFYRHTAKFLARMPFEHPLKVRVLQQITEIDRQMNPYMPDYLLGTANIAGLNVTFGGANPLQAVSETYAPQITNPLLGLGIQRATGTNPFGRDWTNEPPGGSVTLFGGDRYVIHRDGNGNVTGVQPAGEWMPPLYESLLGIIPQAGIFFDQFDRPAWKPAVGMATGLSFPNYDPATAQYYALKNQMAALKQAMGTPPA